MGGAARMTKEKAGSSQSLPLEANCSTLVNTRLQSNAVSALGEPCFAPEWLPKGDIYEHSVQSMTMSQCYSVQSILIDSFKVNLDLTLRFQSSTVFEML